MNRFRGFVAAGAVGALLALSACESAPEDTIFKPVQSGAVASKAPAKPAAKPRQPMDARAKPSSSAISKPLIRGVPTDPKAVPKSTTANKASAKPETKSPAKPAATAATAKPAPPPTQKPGAIEVPPATYRDIAATYNQRTARLQRIWGRAVVSVEYTDEDGDRRWEQGEGHFQVIQPSKMALSAGKLGEVVLWIGCDNDRYWFIDAKEGHRAWVGRHASATREKIESLGMPAPPRDLLALAGITALPAPGADPRRDSVVRWGPDRKVLVFEVNRAGARWRYTVDPRTYEPSRIEVIDSANGEAIISATLEKYEQVKIRGENLVPPRLASRIRCLHHPSGSTLGLSIADMVDGGAAKLRDENFNFEALRQLLGVTEVVDADAPRPAPVKAAGAME